KSVETIKAALDFQGVSVIISREMCHLYARSIKKPGRWAFYVSEKCRNHRTCINELGCPAFSVTDGRVVIDPVMCTGCSVCAQICPEHAILPLKK
ncbi:MAG: 4Fe-4S binding protein, partial [Desulfobacterales bacterium]|nr:4Fe-4S binding protein [Desulfobacterales bacterium]